MDYKQFIDVKTTSALHNDSIQVDADDLNPKLYQFQRDIVRWALAKLSEPLRDVVELGVFQDLPYAEVAEILGIPVGTVKSRMSNALRKLKEIFDEQGS